MIKVISPKAVGVVNYKGFSLVPAQVGKGWRVNIFEPGSTEQVGRTLTPIA